MSELEPKENQLHQNIKSGRDTTVVGRDMTSSKTSNFLMPIFLVGSLAVLGGLAFSLINSGQLNPTAPKLSQPETESENANSSTIDSLQE